MKYIRLFESFSDIDIDSICNKFGIKNWTQNADGTIDVDGNVEIDAMGLKELPVKFGKVSGRFSVYNNQIVTLEGAPSEVGGNFSCSGNLLTTLKGVPREIGGSFYCHYNRLTTLEGAPNYVGGHFWCNNNKLISLEGAPEVVGGDFYCYNNKLTSLEGAPREIGGLFECWKNPIESLYGIFPDYKSYLDSQDYGYLRGGDIVKSRFEEALDELNIRLPESIPGYKYI